MMTWWAWFVWCEWIGDCLYEFLLHLWRHSDDAAMAMERGFDAEYHRLFYEDDCPFPNDEGAWGTRH